MANLQDNHSAAAAGAGPSSHRKPVVIGTYGIQGCGKSTLLKKMQGALNDSDFGFFDGSNIIDSVVPGGLAAFKGCEDEKQKEVWRQDAIKYIGKQCTEEARTGIVAGHFMLWNEEKEIAELICTSSDWATYIHIIYLDVSPDTIAKRRLKDSSRDRGDVSVENLRQWQGQEKKQLQELCRLHYILLTVVSSNNTTLSKVMALAHDFRLHTEEFNMACAKSKLDKAITAQANRLETMLVIDGDKTLAADDTGVLFWKEVMKHVQLDGVEDPWKVLFSGPLKYSYTAFRQATLLCDEWTDDSTFEHHCEKVASMVAVHREFLSLLQKVAASTHVGAVVITCGLRHIWEKVLQLVGLSEKIKVIGGGRISDGYMVSAEVKCALVAHLQKAHDLYVVAFGDSPLDLPMLKQANDAIVVTGEVEKRSRTMDVPLHHAIENEGFHARQVLLSCNASPRLEITKLPLVDITDKWFINSITFRPTYYFLSSSDPNAAKLLMTPIRNSAIAGPALREAHRRIGWFLATNFLGNLIGLEEYPLQHVLHRDTAGYRFLDEEKILIVALMRGGEPMAYGVSDALPRAIFLHTKTEDDIKPVHINGYRTVILVDSVINTGKTIIDAVYHIRGLDARVRIIVVAGVVQADSVAKGSGLAGVLRRCGGSLVALRTSETKYVGRKETDTGNRLFNSTHLA